MPAPSKFSAHNPYLQMGWDATALKDLMSCAYKYKLRHIDNWVPAETKVDLDFGGFYATCTETFHKARLAGKSKIEAALLAVQTAVEISWIDGKPWGGEYATVWRCTGETPYKNRKGNRAKCPYSHAGKWFPAPSPTICGECGSAIQSERRWFGNSKTKDRPGLIRLVTWYCLDQAEHLDNGTHLVPYAFPDGTPGVELSFSFPLTIKNKYGEPFILAGHMDKLAEYGPEKWIADNKTTSKSLSKGYWMQYTPNVQVDTYDFAGATLYQDLKISGVLIEGAQITPDGVKFGLGIMRRTDALREEYMADLDYWLHQAEQHAETQTWPKNRASCFLCEFKGICAKDPDKREMYLGADFVKREWNPLEER